MEKNSLKAALKSSLQAEEEKFARKREASGHVEEQEKKGKKSRKHKKHS